MSAEALDPRTEPLGVSIGSGYCQCGCGHLAPVSDRTHTKYGWVKGEPKRYIDGHRSTRHRPFLVDLESGCWVWQGRKVGTGYGCLERGGRVHLAHRYEYELRHGSIPDGLELDHLCRNKACVNPDHVEPVTHLENMQRYWKDAR